MGSLTVVVAPDSFKGTATAIEAAAAIAEGWSSVRPQDTLVRLPLADGGEGTLDAFEIAVPGAVRMPVTVAGPGDAPVEASWILLPDNSAVVELAATSGITLLGTLRPLDAHTAGFGQAIADALDHGAHRLYLAIGGSSSTDGGVGALAALGAAFTDDAGRPIPPGGRGLARLSVADLSGLRPLPAGGAVVLSDVTNALLGAEGAAAAFGPQKGATAAQIAALDAGLRRLAVLLPADPLAPGSGAAGGTGYGLLAWGADIRSGAVAVGEASGAAAVIASADVVVTGEGRFDGQSEAGKVPSYVRSLASDGRARAMLAAGTIAAAPLGFAAAVSLSDLAGGPVAAMADAVGWLREAGARLATLA